MIDSIRSQRFFALIGTIVLLLAGVLQFAGGVAGISAAAAESAPADDGWRRTVNGWEHISTWNLPPVPSAFESQTFSVAPAWCASWEPSGWLHPAAIAGGLILFGLAGLTLSTAASNREIPSLTHSR
jgi:hypothetical protein